MAIIPEINQKFIKLFSFINKDNKISTIETSYGQKWENMKTDNATINSIFENIDNGDGIVQPEELNILNKIFNYIDNLFNKDEILDKKEIKEFKKQLADGTISLDKLKQQEPKTPEKSWSEGLDRNITTIQISKAETEKNPKLKEDLQAIGEEQGFKLEEIYSDEDPWIEDTSIKRADGKTYIPYHSPQILPEVNIKSARGNENIAAQGRVLETGSAFNVKVDATEKYYGTSYLEGGNVLNSKLNDGTPAAIVGEASIAYSLQLMGLEQTPDNIEKAKEVIAEDLGLSKEQVTFIPQHEFHIDMVYRPLHNGEVAVPDYEKGIEILKKFQADKNMTDTTLQDTDSLEERRAKIQAYKLNKQIKNLEQTAQDSQSIRAEAEVYLQKAGYKIIKIPSFTASSQDGTNFMNGIGGTSNKTGESFYITNKSEYPELQNIIESYLKNAGIDKVYFVSTLKELKAKGGIDCLTQEK